MRYLLIVGFGAPRSGVLGSSPLPRSYTNRVASPVARSPTLSSIGLGAVVATGAVVSTGALVGARHAHTRRTLACPASHVLGALVSCSPFQFGVPALPLIHSPGAARPCSFERWLSRTRTAPRHSSSLCACCATPP